LGFTGHTQRKGERESFIAPEREGGEPFLPANSVALPPLSRHLFFLGGGCGGRRKGKKAGHRKRKTSKFWKIVFSFLVGVAWGGGAERNCPKVSIAPLSSRAWGPGVGE
jgi:hypothetical protein